MEVATVSFCEEIYNNGGVIHGFSQFFNAISSLIFSLVGIWHLYFVGNHTELLSIIGQTILVGIGSFIFHGFPNRFTQMMDELPMILLIISSLKLMIHHIFLTRRLNNHLQMITMFSVDILQICVILFNVSSTFFLIFEMFYIAMILCYVTIALIANWEKRKHIFKNVLIGLLGFSFWLIDQYACTPFLAMFSLHSFWHICMAIVVFNFMELYKIFKIESGGRRIIIKQKGPFFIGSTTGYVEWQDDL